MKKFDIQTRMSEIEIFIAFIVFVVLGAGLYFPCRQFSYSDSFPITVNALFIFLGLMCLCILISAIIYTRKKEIYISTIIIDNDTIQLVYKAGKKIAK